MTDKMSFLPEDYVERRIERRSSVVCLAMFAVVMGAVGGVHLYKVRQYAAGSAQLHKINGQYAVAAKRLEQLDALQQQRQEMLRKAQVTALLLERVPRTFLLADLVNRMPDSLSLLELNLGTKLVQPPRPAANKSVLANKGPQDKKGSDPAGTKAMEEPPPPQHLVTLVLVGVAPTEVQLSDYMSKLQQSPLFSEVTFVYSEETKIAESSMKKFRLELTLSPTADVRSLDAGQRKINRPRDPIQKKGNELPKIGKAPASVGAAVAQRRGTK